MYEKSESRVGGIKCIFDLDLNLYEKEMEQNYYANLVIRKSNKV